MNLMTSINSTLSVMLFYFYFPLEVLLQERISGFTLLPLKFKRHMEKMNIFIAYGVFTMLGCSKSFFRSKDQ